MSTYFNSAVEVQYSFLKKLARTDHQGTRTADQTLKIALNNYVIYFRIEHNEIGNAYILRLPKFEYKALFAKGDTPRSMIHIHTPFMNITGGYVVQFRQFRGT